MKTRGYALAVAIAIMALAPLSGFGQSEKVSLRRIPQPNQSVRMKMVQEMDMDVTMEGPAAVAGATGPIKLSTRNTTTMRQVYGPADSQGNIEAEVTVEEASLETKMTMNDQPLPGAPAPANPMAGKKFSVLYDKLGNIVDTKLPPVPGLPADTFKQLMKSFSGSLPTTPIGIGETATAPLDVAIPLPLPGASQLKMDGQIIFKLLSVDKEGSDRIATVSSTIEGKLVNNTEIPGPNGAAIKMSIDFKMNGGGTTVSNLDKGLVKSSESNSSFGGPIHMDGGGNAVQLPNMNIQAKMRMTITSEDGAAH